MFMFNDLLFVPFEYGRMDCWGLVEEVYRRYGKKLPDINPARAAVKAVGYGNREKILTDESKKWLEINNPEAPCVVGFFNGEFMHHCGVYIGDGRFIHTTKRIGFPVIERLDNPLHARRKFYKYISADCDQESV